MDEADNLHLTSGDQYVTHDSMPLVIDGRRGTNLTTTGRHGCRSGHLSH